MGGSAPATAMAILALVLGCHRAPPPAADGGTAANPQVSTRWVALADGTSGSVRGCEGRVGDAISGGVGAVLTKGVRKPIAPTDRDALATAPLFAHASNWIDPDPGNGPLAADARWPIASAAPLIAPALAGEPTWCPLLAARAARIGAADTLAAKQAALDEAATDPPHDDAPPPLVAVQYTDTQFECGQPYRTSDGLTACLGTYRITAALVWLRVADGAILAAATGKGKGSVKRMPGKLSLEDFSQLNSDAEAAALAQAIAGIETSIARW